MARYQRPPDPRKSNDKNQNPRPRASGQEDSEPFPWLWLGLGVVVTLIGIALAAALIIVMLDRDPLASSLPTPTIIRLTAPPNTSPQDTILPTTAPIPTITSPATPDLSITPDEITIGFYAQVANTENVGVSLRGGPTTDNVRLELVPEGAYLFVIGGPEEGSGFIWWQVQLEEGTEGWVAGDFIIPSAAPETGDAE
jgi:hypothetical protein